MDYQTALEICRAYKACHVRLRQLGRTVEADEMKYREHVWRQEYIKLADKESAMSDVE